MGDVTGFPRADGIDGCAHHDPGAVGLPWRRSGGDLGISLWYGAEGGGGSTCSVMRSGE